MIPQIVSQVLKHQSKGTEVQGEEKVEQANDLPVKPKGNMKLMRKIMQAGRKFMKKMDRSSSSSSDEEHSKRKHKKHRHGKSHKKHESSSSSEEKRHGKCHKKRQEFKEKNRDKVLERRAHKMVKTFGGEPEDYEGFVDETFDMSIKEAINKYAKDKNINLLEERAANKRQQRQRKLALFFNKSEGEFAELVKEHPEANFRELLKILKEKGTYEIDLEDEVKIEGVKSKFLWEKKGERNWKREVKRSKLAEKQEPEKQEQKTEQQELKTEETVNPVLVVEEPEKKEELEREKKKEMIREKGKILIEMKELFGEEKSKELFKFIEENFHLGQEKIVEKWITLEFEKAQQ